MYRIVPLAKPVVEIDEISEMLGGLKADMSYLKDEARLARAQREEVARRLDGIETVSVRVSTLERSQLTHANAIKVLEIWRQRWIGGTAVISFMAAIVGAGILAVFQWILGKH